MNWWVHAAWEQGGAIYLVSWIFWVLFSITLHELAHGWAALWEGDTHPTGPEPLDCKPPGADGADFPDCLRTGRHRLGMMPVRPDRFRHGRLGDAIVAFAGPMMNLVLAFITLTLLGVLSAMGDMSIQWMKSVSLFLFVGGFLNVILFVLNLLPIPPLDGSRILAAASPHARDFYRQQLSQMMAFALLIMIFFFGAADFLFAGSQDAAIWWSGLVARLVGAAPVS